MVAGPLDRWQEVGCGKYCFECPPTPEQARLSFFRCDVVDASGTNLKNVEESASGVLEQRPDLLGLFRTPVPGLAGADGFGPDPTDVVGQDWTVTEHDRSILSEVRWPLSVSAYQYKCYVG